MFKKTTTFSSPTILKIWTYINLYIDAGVSLSIFLYSNSLSLHYFLPQSQPINQQPSGDFIVRGICSADILNMHTAATRRHSLR